MTTAYNPHDLAGWWQSRQHADAVHWTRISAEGGELVREMTGRDDLLAVVEPGSGKGAPAVYLPEAAHIEVNPDVCAPGINPADIHLDTEVGQLAHPGFVGAFDHEGGHAEFSQWPIDQTPSKRAVVQAALLLEEPCMERDVVRKRPHRRVFLRSTFHNIVNKSDEPITTPAGAAHMAALVGGRVDGGVLDPAEVAPIIDTCKTVLGERYEQLRQVWLDAMALPVRDDAAPMEALGQRWLDILGDDAKGDSGEGEPIYVCSHEPGDSGEGQDGQDGEGKSISDMIREVAEQVAESAEAEAAGQKDAAKVRDIVASKKADAAESKKDDAAADEVFKKPLKYNGHGAGYGREGLSHHRAPTAKEQAQANVLAKQLQRAQHRERTVTVISSELPPGRLRGSVAMRRSAEQSMGMLPTAQPWRHKVSKHVDNPPITVGIGCDISGSMRWATEAVASAAWIVAQAVHRNEGDTATVAYGNNVHAVVKPGEAPKQVREFDANGGSENWTQAMRALNGALSMDQAKGVRMLVFISDGHYTGAQHQYGNAMIKRIMASGVKVLWVGFHGQQGKGGRDIVPEGAHYVRITDADEMGRTIGKAMVELLQKA